MAFGVGSQLLNKVHISDDQITNPGYELFVGPDRHFIL